MFYILNDGSYTLDTESFQALVVEICGLLIAVTAGLKIGPEEGVHKLAVLSRQVRSRLVFDGRSTELDRGRKLTARSTD